MGTIGEHSRGPGEFPTGIAIPSAIGVGYVAYKARKSGKSIGTDNPIVPVDSNITLDAPAPTLDAPSTPSDPSTAGKAYQEGASGFVRRQEEQAEVGAAYRRSVSGGKLAVKAESAGLGSGKVYQEAATGSATRQAATAEANTAMRASLSAGRIPAKSLAKIAKAAKTVGKVAVKAGKDL